MDREHTRRQPCSPTRPRSDRKYARAHRSYSQLLERQEAVAIVLVLLATSSELGREADADVVDEAVKPFEAINDSVLLLDARNRNRKSGYLPLTQVGLVNSVVVLKYSTLAVELKVKNLRIHLCSLLHGNPRHPLVDCVAVVAINKERPRHGPPIRQVTKHEGNIASSPRREHVRKWYVSIGFTIPG